MLPRVLEPEVMDTPEEARDYDAMDHGEVNRRFAADFLVRWPGQGEILDLGTGTAQIPLEICRQNSTARIVAVDLAEHMLHLARANVRRAGMASRIRLECTDAKGLPFAPDVFTAVISNSIVHHIPRPETALGEMVRVTAPNGLLFVRDLLRPEDDQAVRAIVDRYAAGANDHARQMFDDSLRAALTLEEVRDLVATLGFDRATVEQTSDRHWTWAARKN